MEDAGVRFVERWCDGLLCGNRVGWQGRPGLVRFVRVGFGGGHGGDGLSGRYPGELPEFGGEEAEEADVPGDGGEAGAGEWGGVAGQAGGAEAGEDAEGEVEAADEEDGGETHRAGGDAEVGDEPEGVGSEVGGESGDEGVEFGLSETVEEEVG